MMEDPRTDGLYQVVFADGTTDVAYWLNRKSIWVTPDGASAVEGVVSWKPLD